MAIAVEMPKMSDTMEEGVLVAWLADEGDAVAAGDVIAQVETDKATMDLEVYDDGVLLKRVVDEGASVPIGALIAVLGDEGEDPSDVLAAHSGDGAATAEPVPSKPDTAPEADAGGDGAAAQPVPSGDTPSPSDDGGRVKASPLARRMAQEAGLDLANLSGSGPEGRVVKRDVEAALGGASGTPSAQPVAPAQAQPVPAADRAPAPRPQPATDAPPREVPITQMRKAIARRLAQSKFTSPHFYLTAEIDMTAAVEIRPQVNELTAAQGLAKVSYNDFITKACAVALKRHPAVNASWTEERGVIVHHPGVHVAVAVAIEDGLITPVIRDADRKGLAQIAAETRELAGRARDKKLDPSEFEGSTFTTSNLGMFGIEEFTAIINPPNACILAIGAIVEKPVVQDGAIVVGKRMRVTLSCDHRVVDGAVGAAFLADVKAHLESPMTMLI